MSFSFVKLPELDFELNSETTPYGRYYATPKGKYASITTVLSHFGNKKALQEWRNRVGKEQANKITYQAASRGTAMHTVCEDLLNGKVNSFYMMKLMPHIKELFLQLKPIITDKVNNVYAIEQPLYSNHLKVAGRVDCIAEYDGKISIIDYKTSTKEKREDWIENYFLQCTAYAIMFEEITGKKVEQIVVMIACETGFAQVFIKKPDDYKEKLEEYVKKYYLTCDEV